MVQVLPYVQTPLEQLLTYISQAVGNVADGIGQFKANRSDEAIMKQLPNASPIELLGLIPKLSEDKRKEATDLYSPYIKEHAKQQGEIGGNSSLTNEDYSQILDELEDDVKTGKAGLQQYLTSFIPGPIGAAARENTARFQSKATSLLGLAQKVALRQGIRNQNEFKTFLSRTIPNDNDTVETSKGKIDALRSYIKGGKIPESAYKVEGASSEFVKIKAPNGKEYDIPKGEADAAIKAGGKKVG